MQTFLQRFFFKKLARHLRRPGGWFGKKVGDKMNAANAFLYDAALDIMLPAPGDTILEIGFGNGKLFDKIFSRAERITVCGLDFSETMVKEAKNNSASMIASGKLNLQYGNSDHLPFADTIFDKVFCINVVYFWDPPAPHLKEVSRVLKPGGKFFSVIRSKESIRQMPFANYGFIQYEQEEWAGILRSHHFNVKRIETISEPEAKLKGKSYPVESWCFIAEKEI